LPLAEKQNKIERMAQNPENRAEIGASHLNDEMQKLQEVSGDSCHVSRLEKSGPLSTNVFDYHPERLTDWITDKPVYWKGVRGGRKQMLSAGHARYAICLGYTTRQLGASSRVPENRSLEHVYVSEDCAAEEVIEAIESIDPSLIPGIEKLG